MDVRLEVIDFVFMKKLKYSRSLERRARKKSCKFKIKLGSTGLNTGFTVQASLKEHASRAQNISGCLDKSAEPKLNWLSYPADGLNGLRCEGFIESTTTLS